MGLEDNVKKLEEASSNSNNGSNKERTHTGYMNLRVVGGAARALMEVGEVVLNSTVKKMKVHRAKNSIFVEAVEGSKKPKDIADGAYQAIVDDVYDDIEEYLNEDPSNSVEDPECPSRYRLRLMVVECYSVERHSDIFDVAEFDEDDELG